MMTMGLVGRKAGGRMRIESLRYFLEIAQFGSFSLAARKLYISQQGLSKAAQALEKELGVDLFERSGKNVHLTEAGRAFAPLARRCVDAHDAAKEAMLRFARTAEDAEKIEVMVMPFVSGGLFSLMKDELYAYGLRDAVLVEKSLPDIVGDLVSGGGEPKPPAIVCLPDRMLACLLHNPDVEYVPLFRSCMGVVGTKDLLSPRKRSMTVAEVARLPIACYNEPILDAILAEMFAAHPFQNVIMHASNIPLIDEYVQGGRAVTFSDSFSDFLNPNPSGLLFIPIERSVTFSVGFVHSRRAGLEDGAARYVERFRRCIEETCEAYFAKHPLDGMAWG